MSSIRQIEQAPISKDEKARLLTQLFQNFYVECSITGERIPLPNLRYWNVELNEVYKDCVTAFYRNNKNVDADDENSNEQSD